MKILVTGGAGFIGSHVVDRLVLEGHSVSVIDNLSTGKIENVNREAKFHKIDIISPRIERVFKKERPELICHFAAQMDVRRSVADPIYDAQSNIIGMLNLMENGLRYGVRKVIFASTGGAVYGEGVPYPTSEECIPRPISPYGISKLTGEHYLIYYNVSYGLNYVVLRYANVYGPRQDPFGEAGVVAIFNQKILRDEQPVINGNGMQTRDYVYVDDVVDAVIASTYNDINDVLNVGTGVETSVNELFRHLIEITGKSHIKEVHGQAKKGEQLRSCLSYDKIRKALDWEPRVPLREGLTRTIEFFRGRL
ncbi:MAG: UDP-glucose 4-epimerase [Nitrospirae bacterium RIFCSPHIGHO2_02_FULL_42_12]|nr:MAG: UDP-glucose 4-epimerase [Nitrospirae bacterium RIFCSPHIGHO2_02_FULL_42_12]